jgi:glycosyltransferase involved in cell wall biosynthesis
MRVLHVDTGREWRGGQAQLAHLAEEVGLGIVVPPGAPLEEVARKRGIPVWTQRMTGPLAAFRLRRLAARVGSDAIAAHTSRAHGLALLAGRPVIVHRRVDFRPSQLSRLKYARARGYVAVSAAVADILATAGVPAERIVVVRDGVPAESLTAATLPLSRPWVLAVGALVPHKGHRVLVDAMPQLPGIHVAIAGEGPLRAALLDRARELGVAHRLCLLGWRPDARALMSDADAVVHPSVEEGLGQCVIEALWSGVPVVATRAGGVPEVVREGGQLVRPGDPSALAEAIRDVIGAPAPWRARAAAARPRLEQDFSLAAMRRGTLDAYRRLLRSTSADGDDTRGRP